MLANAAGSAGCVNAACSAGCVKKNEKSAGRLREEGGGGGEREKGGVRAKPCWNPAVGSSGRCSVHKHLHTFFLADVPSLCSWCLAGLAETAKPKTWDQG
ncbi:hypothetical protein U9M48_019786 [Paspalum notatum var. saurae]|uniref:Uncharacterized protein n=1 Tax=Paspalum notatum var. saurae TaxID=547442 RepID=A0AAQ3TFL2_PASNO